MNGTFHLTATNSTFSYVDFVPGQTSSIPYLRQTQVAATGGAPRLSVGELPKKICRFFSVPLSFSPNFTDTDAVLNTWSGVNLIGNNDAGRYDTSQFNGGSPFTT